MAWTGFTSKRFVSNTAGMDYLEQANTDQARAHRNAMANRAKQEEHAARETSKKQAREGRREANRAAAKERRASRVKAREKSDRVAMYLDATLDEDQVRESISIAEDPQVADSPYVSLPTSGPMDYLQSLTSAQAEAAGSLGTDPSVIEGAGLVIGADQMDSWIAKVEEAATPGAGATYSSKLDEIRIPTRGMEGGDLDQLTRHELLHRLVTQLEKLGILDTIPLPEMQAIIEKFDPDFQGDATVQDFINFVQMNKPIKWNQETRTFDRDVIPATGSYFDKYYPNANRFDPRARTAGWDYSLQSNLGGYYGEDIEGRGDAPWAGSGERGKQDFDAWMAFQRELPSEKYGGAVMGAGAGETVPWGPATVNWEWQKQEILMSDGRTSHKWIRTPVSTGTPNPTSYGHVTMQGDARTEAGIPLVDQEPVRNIRSQTGLGNWPMGDEHALLAAQAAQHDLPGQQNYVSPSGDTSNYYGKLARFNRAAALKAHPDSKIRHLAEANIPDIVLDKMTEALLTGGDDIWGQLGSWENAKNYLDQLMKQYQAGMIPQ